MTREQWAEMIENEIARRFNATLFQDRAVIVFGSQTFSLLITRNIEHGTLLYSMSFERDGQTYVKEWANAISDVVAEHISSIEFLILQAYSERLYITKK